MPETFTIEQVKTALHRAIFLMARECMQSEYPLRFHLAQLNAIDAANLEPGSADKYHGAHYAVEIGGIRLDPYRILLAYGITHPAQGHAINKMLRAGKSEKTLEQDIRETIGTLERWLDMMAEDSRTPSPGRAATAPDATPGLRHNRDIICAHCGKVIMAGKCAVLEQERDQARDEVERLKEEYEDSEEVNVAVIKQRNAAMSERDELRAQIAATLDDLQASQADRRLWKSRGESFQEAHALACERADKAERAHEETKALLAAKEAELAQRKEAK